MYYFEKAKEFSKSNIEIIIEPQYQKCPINYGRQSTSTNLRTQYKNSCDFDNGTQSNR